MVIELSSEFNKVEDLWGSIDSKIVIYMDPSLAFLVPEFMKILDSKHLLTPFIETLPSTLLLKQIFNEKIKIGNLILDKPPKIVILPSGEMKALKEWDILLLQENYAKLSMFVAAEVKDELCKFDKLAVPNPEFSYLGRVFMSIYTAKCKPTEVIFSNLYHREIPAMVKQGLAKAGVLWEHEAKINGLNGFSLNKTVNLEIGVMKGCEGICLEEAKILTSDEFKNGILAKFGIEYVGK